MRLREVTLWDLETAHAFPPLGSCWRLSLLLGSLMNREASDLPAMYQYLKCIIQVKLGAYTRFNFLNFAGASSQWCFLLGSWQIRPGTRR